MAKKQANYDFDDAMQKSPKKRMGQGEFDNLPKEVIMKPFPRSTDFKSGITNRFERDVEIVSGIPENNC